MPHTAAAFLPHKRLILLAGLVTVVSASAQNKLTSERTITHQVLAGDTLEQLSRRYLGDGSLWPALQSHNGVSSPYRLKPGSLLEIPLQLMRAATASVDYVQGTAHIQRSGASTAATRGMPLQEGDRLKLDPDAFVAVKLADGSTVRVQAASQVQLSQLRRRGRAGSLQSVLEVEQGGIEVKVPGKPDAYRRLDVLTPVAATSVRGTEFDVQLAKDGSSTTAVLNGRVALQSLLDTEGSRPAALLSPQTGVRVNANGQVLAITDLLPAPPARELPSLNEDAQWLTLTMPAWKEAQGWRAFVSKDALGKQVLRNGQFAGNTARFAAIEDGDYFLHVRAVDTQGISGMPATVPLRVKAHPVPPLPQSPAPSGVLAQGEAQLQCTPVAGVHNYRHQVIALERLDSPAAPSDFAHPFLQHSSSEQCHLDLSTLPAGTYAWRAASVRMPDNQLDQGPFGAAHIFRIAPKPSALSPDDLQVQTLMGRSVIHWQGEAGQRFRLQAFPSADSTEPTLDTMLAEPRWTATGLPAGTWFIRIQVQDPSGLSSAFSPARSVQVLELVQDGFGNPISTSTGLGVEHR